MWICYSVLTSLSVPNKVSSFRHIPHRDFYLCVWLQGGWWGCWQSGRWQQSAGHHLHRIQNLSEHCRQWQGTNAQIWPLQLLSLCCTYLTFTVLNKPFISANPRLLGALCKTVSWGGWGWDMSGYQRMNVTHLSVCHSRIALEESAWETVSILHLGMLSTCFF